MTLDTKEQNSLHTTQVTSIYDVFYQGLFQTNYYDALKLQINTMFFLCDVEVFGHVCVCVPYM